MDPTSISIRMIGKIVPIDMMNPPVSSGLIVFMASLSPRHAGNCCSLLLFHFPCQLDILPRLAGYQFEIEEYFTVMGLARRPSATGEKWSLVTGGHM